MWSSGLFASFPSVPSRVCPSDRTEISRYIRLEEQGGVWINYSTSSGRPHPPSLAVFGRAWRTAGNTITNTECFYNARQTVTDLTRDSRNYRKRPFFFLLSRKLSIAEFFFFDNRKQHSLNTLVSITVYSTPTKHVFALKHVLAVILVSRFRDRSSVVRNSARRRPHLATTIYRNNRFRPRTYA